jgi:hypothetical protein
MELNLIVKQISKDNLSKCVMKILLLVIFLFPI